MNEQELIEQIKYLKSIRDRLSKDKWIERGSIGMDIIELEDKLCILQDVFKANIQ